jgi:hypothetical protein
MLGNSGAAGGHHQLLARAGHTAYPLWSARVCLRGVTWAIFDLVIDTPAMLEAIKQSRNESEADMSDESGQSEQPQEQAPKWRDPISPERQEELQGYLDRWQAVTDHGERKRPFAKVRLTGADVFWLAEQSGHDKDGDVPNLQLEGG